MDAWVALTAAAMGTERIKLGTMITPLSRMRPWKLASETATLDHLSKGRVILSVGLGAVDTGFAEFGEVTDRKTRAELLDEGLDVLTGLWRGQPFSYEGKHYKIKECHFPMTPPPLVQQPRIPIWVVGVWPRQKSMARALRYDGLLPGTMSDQGQQRSTPDDIRTMKAYIEQRRTPFDIVVEGNTEGKTPDEAKAEVRSYAEAGATWWLEANWVAKSLESVLARIRQGPPRID
jgi:alkanesulfonate monooxygenase SsuD/methylene tetrahydromethanopterin reductase-like flavin-dependent oxidoreductase (luciferase family)